MPKHYYILLALLLNVTSLLAQQGTLQGQVYSTKSNEPLESTLAYACRALALEQGPTSRGASSYLG